VRLHGIAGCGTLFRKMQEKHGNAEELVMSRGMRAVLALLGVSALAVIVMGLTGWWWWTQHGQEFQSNVKTGMEEGRKFGKHTDENGCLAEGFDRNREHPEAEVGMLNAFFMAGCLSDADPSEGFCKEVPSQWNNFAVARWSEKRCTAEGLATPSCAGMLNTVVTHCQSKS
jgi:hypothetical protein